MDDEVPTALPVGPDDDDKRAFAWALLKDSNEVVIGFAKLMSTTSMAAIGVLLTLAAFAGVGTTAGGWTTVVVALSGSSYLAAALVFSVVVRGRRINISPDDYDDVVEQFLAAASSRQRTTNVGLVLLTLATASALVSILGALRDLR
jgi:hypothetical protein